MKKLILLLLLTITAVTNAQTFLQPTSNTVGDLPGGDGIKTALTSFTDPDTQKTRDWLFMSHTTGQHELGDFKSFAYIYEKIGLKFIKRTTDSLNFLAYGGSTFTYLNGEKYPSLASTGLDISGKSRT